MRYSTNELQDYQIQANDGEIGSIVGFLFDDETWTLRYLVVDTGKWLLGRKVLIPPAQLGEPDRERQQFPLDLTKQQIKDSPDINTDQPVSRQQEVELYKYYRWSPYWGGVMGPITTPYAPIIPPARKEIEESTATQADQPQGNPHLRSTDEVQGYYISATDGEIGHVEDFIVNSDDWAIRYFVIDTRNWLPGRKVIIPPNWISDICWATSKVTVDVTQEAVKSSPEYDPSIPMDQEYEDRLFAAYGRQKQWSW